MSYYVLRLATVTKVTTHVPEETAFLCLISPRDEVTRNMREEREREREREFKGRSGKWQKSVRKIVKPRKSKEARGHKKLLQEILQRVRKTRILRSVDRRKRVGSVKGVWVRMGNGEKWWQGFGLSRVPTLVSSFDSSFSYPTSCRSTRDISPVYFHWIYRIVPYTHNHMHDEERKFLIQPSSIYDLRFHLLGKNVATIVHTHLFTFTLLKFWKKIQQISKYRGSPPWTCYGMSIRRM